MAGRGEVFHDKDVIYHPDAEDELHPGMMAFCIGYKKQYCVMCLCFLEC